MAEKKKKTTRTPKVRQNWKPHWIISILLRLWQMVFGAAKIALGAAATVVVILGVCVLVFVGVLGDYLEQDILPNSSVELPITDHNSKILHVKSDGSIGILQEIYPEVDSEWATYEDIPEHLIHAAIAIEDKRFYEHQGVDWITTVKACFFMFFGNGDRGGSTITQQLVKNTTGENTYTVQRKVLEIFRAADLERRYNKQDILEQYLNRIYMGRRCTGVKTAAAEYFGKELEMLTIAECASLISVTNNPSLYNPYRTNLDAGGKTGAERNRARQMDVLNQMLEQEWITQEEYDEAVAQEMVFKEGIAPEDRMTSCTADGCGYRGIVGSLTVTDNKYYCPQCGAEVKVTSNASQVVYSYYVDTVIEEVARALAEKDGITEWTDSVKSLYTDRVESGGYSIFACYDEEVQAAVDKIYKDLSQIPNGRSGQQLQSAIVIVDNSTGDVVAMAGGVGDDKVHDGYNRAEVPLQSGSSIKPISVYAPAFESGLFTPATVIKDMPLNYDPGYGWPKNDNHKYLYTRTIFTGVRQSANAIAANTLKLSGLNYAYDFAKYKFGLSTLLETYNSYGTEMSDIDYAPLAMGAQTKGVTVRDMATAYSTFSNGGLYRESRTFTKVYDRNGNLVLDNTQDSREILGEKAVNYMNYCLQFAVSNGTGGEASIYGQTVYGKTGTTSNNKDRWFCGFTKYYSAAVWVGYDQPEVITGIYGNPAAQLFSKVLAPLHRGLPRVSLFDTRNMVKVTICLESGLKATEACKKDVREFYEEPVHRTEEVYVYRDDIPEDTCDKHVVVEYCTEGNGVCNEYCRKFAAAEVEEEEPVTTIEERALVKLTQQEMDDILKAKKYGLQEAFWNDYFMYYVDKQGKDLPFKGLTGNEENEENVPYMVCTVHNAENWEAYEEAHKKEEEGENGEGTEGTEGTEGEQEGDKETPV